MPRIQTTRTVRVALWALRIYLLVLLTLIGIKFVRVFSAQKADTAATPAAAATNGPAVGTPPAEKQ
jgi:hypothetical protein